MRREHGVTVSFPSSGGAVEAGEAGEDLPAIDGGQAVQRHQRGLERRGIVLRRGEVSAELGGARPGQNPGQCS